MKIGLFELGMLLFLSLVIYGVFTTWTPTLLTIICGLATIMGINMWRENKTKE